VLVVKYVEPWARTHQQRWHAEALQMYGEKIVFRHRWNIQDYALGRVGRCSACSGGTRLNEQQRVRVVDATGGTFTLTFAGQTTDPIDWDATATELRDALEALEVNDPGDVSVATSGLISSPGLTVEFLGKWASTDIPVMTYSVGGLTPPGSSLELIQIRTGGGGASVQDRISAVYKQAGDSWCTSCFGVGFEGGFEPIVYVTWALVGDQQQETTRTRSGAIQKQDPHAQFSFEPIVQEFDMIARVYEWEADGITPVRIGGRYLIREVMPVTIRTGPGSPDDSIAVMPEEFRTQYRVPNPEWTVGQKGGIEILPYEHAWNMVPLSRQEERLLAAGAIPSRRWYEQAGVEQPFQPEETHP
jgi:hypothetical protein